jgi:Fur family transcriptional regulator, zinc uptake regulator
MPAPDIFQPHDHGFCRTSALDGVLEECATRGLRLTSARLCVLETLLAGHRAMTAYELLDRLRAEDLGSQPPIVYRALDFLIENGFVHRVERLSAYVACTCGKGRHEAVFLVCRDCRRVAEATLPTLSRSIAEEARGHAFNAERITIEVEGICDACRGKNS